MSNQCSEKREELDKLTQQTISALDSQAAELKHQYEGYQQVLQNNYDASATILNNNYRNNVVNLTNNIKIAKQIGLAMLEETQEELESLQATRNAAVEAARREKELEQSPDNFRIQLTEEELSDIRYLESIKGKLFHKEILGKLIWSVFFQSKVKQLGIKLCGDSPLCGIYKITDLATKEVYIGQSVNIQRRWVDHVRCGVGADVAPHTNMLYAAMRRDGLENFTFEVLERCQRDKLNEKEQYFIRLYNSDTFGLNLTKGNERKRN